MFRGQIAVALIALVALTGWMIYECIQVRDRDREFYRILVESSDPIHSKEERTVTYTQVREGNQKEGWFAQGADRLHFRLESEIAELQVSQHEKTVELVEHMQGLRCVMQEALYYLFPDGTELLRGKSGQYYLRKDSDLGPPLTLSQSDISMLKPMQRVRRLDAEEASYYYKDNLIVAERVNMARFAASTHQVEPDQPIQDPLMTGIAETVEFNFEEHIPIFRAHHMKAKFHSKRGML